MAPTSPGFPAAMRPGSIARYGFPDGTFWAADLDRRRQREERQQKKGQAE